MKTQVFNLLVKETFKNATEILSAKAKTYATKEDRLDNFKQAAGLSRRTPVGSLKGMVDKHIVALSDFVYAHEHGFEVPAEEWEEKIGDIINYMVLLSAMLKEEDLI